MEVFIRRLGGILGTLRAEYRQLYNRYFGTIERFDGNATQICQQIIKKLWEGDFYRTSLGHFDFFWMRDFGTVCRSLVALGHAKRVHHTLAWALFHYRRAGEVTLCIDKAGNTFNAPAKKSVDALPWLLHCLAESNYSLGIMERSFLEGQLKTYAKTFLDKEGNLLNLRYAEMRDAVYYDRSAYAVTLIAEMVRCAAKLGLKGMPFGVDHYKKDLLTHYWTGDYFRADRATDAYSSECALMPFYLGIIDDPQKAAKTFDYIQQAGLNKLYPLIYCQQPDKFHYRIGMGKWLMPNYTGTTIWSWHGTFYLHLLKRYNRPEYKRQLDHFSAMIERHKTYPELLNDDGSWYKTLIYKSDPGMVWAALFLALD
jgi:hypothetical protein